MSRELQTLSQFEIYVRIGLPTLLPRCCVYRLGRTLAATSVVTITFIIMLHITTAAAAGGGACCCCWWWRWWRWTTRAASDQHPRQMSCQDCDNDHEYVVPVIATISDATSTLTHALRITAHTEPGRGFRKVTLPPSPSRKVLGTVEGATVALNIARQSIPSRRGRQQHSATSTTLFGLALFRILIEGPE